MYITGYGFHTDWKNLLAASLVWKTIRPLRLARARHAQDLANGTVRVNLASLPSEVMQIIEQQLVEPTMKEIRNREPFEFDDECCQHAIEAYLDSDEYTDAFADFAMDHGFLPHSSKDLDAAYKAFMNSQESAILVREAAENHDNEGDCEKARTSFDYWGCLRSGAPYKPRYGNGIIPLLIASDQAVATFASDFNMQVYRRSDGSSQCDWEEQAVTLLVASSVAHHAQVEHQPKSDSLMPKVFTRSPYFLCLPYLKLVPVRHAVKDQLVDVVNTLKLVTLEEGSSHGQTVLYSLVPGKQKK